MPSHEQQQQQQQQSPHSAPKKEWIRGVNIGGWLLAERFITPYLFAVNSCHLQGSLCWYPGQMGSRTSAEQTATLCDPTLCQPMLSVHGKPPTDYHLIHGLEAASSTSDGRGITSEGTDYPVDEYTLGKLLRTAPGPSSSSPRTDTAAGMGASATTASVPSPSTPRIATQYMERHWETFLTYHDLHTLQEHGVTHLRIPMGYWIRNTPQLSILDVDAEPYIPGGWPYFVRACRWARSLGLTVWADLHGAPGSENGFDNSGHYLGHSSCDGWSKSPKNVQRTLDILTDLCVGIVDDQISDVVTGFGILNEPFADCPENVVRQYYNDALEVVRSILGDTTSVFVGDTFRATKFNDGQFWLNATKYHDTYLDSHPYHVFFEQGRSFTPKQHIAYVCRHDTQAVQDCCYDDGPETNTIVSTGISRLTGEWSAAYDILPTAMTPYLMKGILHNKNNSAVPYLHRTLTPPQTEFLTNFVKAQMIAYEADVIAPGLASGWLFWNFKMEGGAFIEWDFLRGLKEGWIPSIPDKTISSESVYGSCLDIYNQTKDYEYYDIVTEYPDPRTLDWNQWQGWDANDDFVMSDPNIPPNLSRHYWRSWYDLRRLFDQPWFVPFMLGLLVLGIYQYWFRRGSRGSARSSTSSSTSSHCWYYWGDAAKNYQREKLGYTAIINDTPSNSDNDDDDSSSGDESHATPPKNHPSSESGNGGMVV